MSREVEHEPERHRYVITVDGADAGTAYYVDADGSRVFTHTVVDPAYEGRGLGSELVAAALADTRDAGLRITPQCPFVAAWVKRHHEYDDIIDAAAD
ncbi:N-acetyltransferase [Cnuibacter physcomitrellae]|uniref:GNAT family N-acetyltransferase n=1 Tax=Cnuibacter physcomitrellae TaxID=1619308 RepID=UPI0021759AF3|nr:GNAT family N-acetyltransferase [Cnuibacter physcomitrellae]MCS5498780.1 N-acetyltransferase [Cnuibacter physcomitrellae]